MGNSQSNRKITIEKDEMTGVIKLSDSVVRRLRGEIERAASSQVIKEHKIAQKEKSWEEPAEQPIVEAKTQSEAPTSPEPLGQPSIVESQPNIAEVQPNVAEVQPNVAEIQPNVAEIQPSVAEIQPNIAEIQPNVAEIQPNVAEIQPNVVEILPTPEISQPESAPSTVQAPVLLQQQPQQPQPQQQPSEPRPYEEFMEEAHLTALKIRKDMESEIRKVEEYWRTQLTNLTNEYGNLGELAEEKFHVSVADVESCYAKESFSNVCGVPKEEVLQCYLANKEQPLNCSEHVKRFKACAEQFRLANLAPKSTR